MAFILGYIPRPHPKAWLIESKEKNGIFWKEYSLKLEKRGESNEFGREEIMKDFQDNGQEEKKIKKEIFLKKCGDIEMPLNSGRVLWFSGAH